MEISTSDLARMADLTSVFDWASTPLGDAETWPQSLKTAVDMMLASGHAMCLAWGSERTLLYNDGYVPMLGNRHPDALGLPLREAWPDVWEEIAPLVNQVFAGETVRSADMPLRTTRHGYSEQTWWTFSYSPVRDEAGVIAGLLNVPIDTTPKVRAERALQESDERHRLLVGSWAQARWEADAEGLVVADSPSWRAYTGQTLDEWLGLGWLDAIHPDDRTYAEQQWREAMAAWSPVDAEFRLCAPDGGWRWTNVRAVPLLDAQGRIEKWAGINIDIDARKCSEEALRESEEMRRFALDSGRMGAWSWDTARDLIRGDAVFMEVYGFPPSDEAFPLSRFTARMSPEAAAACEAVAARALIPEEEFEGDLALAVDATAARWVRWRGRAGRHTPSEIHGVSFDITEQKLAEHKLKESEERQAFLLKLSDAVSPLAAPADIQGETTRLLREQLGAGWCYYVDWDLDRMIGLVLRDSASEGLPSLAGEHDVSDAPKFVELLAGGAVRTVRDYAGYEHLPARIRQDFAALGFRSMMMAPLVKEGHLIATLIVGDTEARDWSTSEASLLVEVAERTWAAVERARAEAALRESEIKFRTLFEGLDEGLSVQELIFNDHGRVVDWIYREANNAFERQGGFPNPYGKRGSEVVPKVAQQVLDLMDRVARTGQAERSESHITDIDRYIRFHTSRVGGAGSRLLAVVFEDITDRRRAESTLRESEQALASDLANAERLRSLSERLVSEENLQAIYDEILTAFVAIARADAGTVQVYDPATKSLELIASHNFSHTVTDFFQRVDAGSRSACGIALKTGERTFADFLDEADDFGCQLLTGEGIRSAVAVPLISRTGMPLGMLNAHWRQARHRLNERELRFLDLLARQAADLIDQRRSQSALRESEERFRDALEIETVGATFWQPGEYTLARSNDAFLRMIGRTREEAIGISSEELTAPEFREDSKARVAEAERTGILAPYEKQVLRPDGSRVWLLCAGRLLKDELFEFVLDVDERHRTDAALRESEERVRGFGDASQDILWIRDAETLAWTYLTPAFDDVYGVSRDEALNGDNFRNWLELIVPEDRGHAKSSIERVREGELVTFEYRIRRPSDGKVRWLRDTDFPMRDGEGQVVSFGGIGHDVTALKASEEHLTASEERLRSAVEVAKLGLWDWDMQTGEISWSDEHFRMEGYAVGEITPSYNAWASRVHPDDRADTEAAIASARDTRTEYVHEFRCLFPDGSVHWHAARGRFFYDKTGAPVRMIGAQRDTTERREAEERQKILLAELQHRVRNILAVIRSMVSRSDDGERATEEYVQHLQGRISALARTQVLLTRSAGAGVDLEDLVRDELLAQAAKDDQFSLDGPDVELSPKAAEVLTLAIHELATNATKYGAFSRAAGRLEVEWNVEARADQNWLVLNWTERGVPIIDVVPRRQGFGTELISRRIPYELKGTGSFELKPGGLESHIEFPLRPGDSILQTNGVA